MLGHKTFKTFILTQAQRKILTGTHMFMSLCSHCAWHQHTYESRCCFKASAMFYKVLIDIFYDCRRKNLIQHKLECINMNLAQNALGELMFNRGDVWKPLTHYRI